MTDTENTTAHEEPKSKTPSIPTVSEILLFKSGWQEFGFVLAVMLGQSFNLTPFGATLNARWLIADDLGVPGDNGQMSWIAAGFSITTGQLRSGRRSTGRLSGFARSPAFYDAARGLTGIGAGLMLPTAVALLGQTYPPGRKRNLAFGLFGALAPFSAAGGSVLEVLLAQLVNPQWIWWLQRRTHKCWPRRQCRLARGVPRRSGPHIVQFFIQPSTTRRMASPSVIAPVVIGIVTLLLFALWEIKGAKSPILPFGIWKAPTFLAVMCSAFLSFMSFGIFIFYHIQFIHDFRGTTALQSMAWLVPFTVNGFIAACLVAALISRVPAQVIFCAGLVAVMIANILTMTAPVSGSYWAAPFVAALIAPFGPDMTFTAAQLVASNTVRRSEQGVAGSLVGTALNYGMALGIGLGGTVEAYTNAGGTQPLRGLRGAMYLGCGMAVLGISIVVFLVRVPKDKREGYDDEEELPEKIGV
ncbi:major facilitator superfamily domain-containing protein [Mycena olivaceomarginata]|nr:major facilitator superfamily domain-containing protein [Mycena olivaceomarginata]